MAWYSKMLSMPRLSLCHKATLLSVALWRFQNAQLLVARPLREGSALEDPQVLCLAQGALIHDMQTGGLRVGE